jgi:hypothetical protein
MAEMVAIQSEIIPEEESPHSSVSWGAIAAGGIASAAFTLFLVELVAGLGLVMVSPWSNTGVSASTLSVAGGIALVLMAVMASALGGYIAGRLRTRWVGIKTDEVYFRDTAHGLLAWAVGTIILATVLASAAGTFVTSVTQGAASNPALVPDRNSYFVDMLFRGDRPVSANPGVIEQTNAEASRLFARAVAPGSAFTSNDRTRLAQLVAARTGLSQQEAEQRVDQVITQAKTAADEARKAASKMAFWMAASLLAGALAASLAAVEGGRERDD